MTRLNIKFSVLPKEVEELLFDELSVLAQKFSNAIYKRLSRLSAEFKELTREIFREGRMNEGLVGTGDLAGAFGIPSEEIVDTADQILDIIADNVYISYNSRVSTGNLSGTLTIQISNQVYQDLSSASFAEIITNKGETLPWIEWSLFRGDEIIIDEYDVFFHVGSGRSDLAIMKKNYGRGFWKVPSDVSGTEENNWIIREIKKNRDKYDALTQSSLLEILNSII